MLLMNILIINIHLFISACGLYISWCSYSQAHSLITSFIIVCEFCFQLNVHIFTFWLPSIISLYRISLLWRSYFWCYCYFRKYALSLLRFFLSILSFALLLKHNYHLSGPSRIKAHAASIITKFQHSLFLHHSMLTIWLFL